MTITRQQIMTAIAAGNATLAEIAEHCKCREQDVRKPCSNAKTGGLLDSYLDDVTGSLAYRLTAAGKKWGTAPEGDADATDTPAGQPGEAAPVGDVKPDFGRDPELQYLAPEDYELPPADPALLASANRMLCERLDGVAHALRGSGMECLAEISGNADLAASTAVLASANQMNVRTIADMADTVAAKIAVIDALRADVRNAAALADKLQRLLDSKTHECEALRAEIGTQHQGVADADPDMDTVSLRALLEAVSTFVDDGQSITVHCASHVTLRAFGREFVCSPGEAASLLDASAMLIRAEAA